jgi:hypothetical protein
VRAVRPDPSFAGYWEIMTSALADYPGQARAIEIVDNGNDTLSIYATIIDFDADDCMERRYRRLMNMEWASAWANDISHNAADYNVQLLVPLPTGAASTVTSYMGGSDRIESETTLRGL